MSFSITHLDIHCSPGNYGFKPVSVFVKEGALAQQPIFGRLADYGAKTIPASAPGLNRMEKRCRGGG